MRFFRLTKEYSFLLAGIFITNAVIITFVFGNSSQLIVPIAIAVGLWRIELSYSLFLQQVAIVFFALSMAFLITGVFKQREAEFTQIHLKKYLSLWLIIQSLILLIFALPFVRFFCFGIM